MVYSTKIVYKLINNKDKEKMHNYDCKRKNSLHIVAKI